jgi:2-O-methyltransferase
MFNDQASFGLDAVGELGRFGGFYNCHGHAIVSPMMKIDLSSLTPEKGDLNAKAVRRLVKRDDPVILEIGANDGQTTLAFLKHMPRARIYCFEPEPRALVLFKSRVNHPQVKLSECAVGNRNGWVTFHQSSGIDEFSDWNASGSIRPPKEHLTIWPKVTFESEIQVPIVRLDDWFKSQSIDRIDFIWADIQGAEGDLIQGGIETINKSRFFYTEYGFRELYEGQYSLADIDARLEEFSVKRLFKSDVLFANMRLEPQESPEWSPISLLRRLVGLGA